MPKLNKAKQVINFNLDHDRVQTDGNETIWQVAKRLGKEIPHLCWKNSPGYRADGNCRACMVEIEGERVLSASCIRKPEEGMNIYINSKNAVKNREMVFELLLSDMPDQNESPNPESHFWKQVKNFNMEIDSRFCGSRPGSKSKIPVESIFHDASHPSIAVNLDACISCGLCERACREVQVNDVIGMGSRGSNSLPVFDIGDQLGLSSCVACGECVQACPTGALMEKTLLNDQFTKRIKYPDRVKKSICPFCGVGCQTEVNLKGDEIISVNGRQGPANRGKLCVKGRFGMDYVMSPQRLTKPLIRRKNVYKDPKIKISFSEIDKFFYETSWEEALNYASDGLIKTFKNNGGKSIAGFGSAKGTNEEAYLFQKFIRQVFGTNNVDHCTRLCHASSVAALMEGVGSGAVSAPFTAADDSDCILIIGARPEQNHPVAATYFKQAAKRGANLIVMDVRKQGIMRLANFPVIFNAGTDVAILNAMLYTIIEEKLYDKQYIQSNIEGFEALSKKIKDFSPENMSEICNVDPIYIRNIARTFAKSEKAIIFWGMGISQHVHGTDNARCLIALSLITGHIGRPGTGIHPLRGQNNVQGASDAGLIPMVYPNYQSVEDPNIRNLYEDFWGVKLDPNNGLTVVEIMNEVNKKNIKALYVQGENPAMSDPNQNHAREALSKLDHLVVQDIFFTETANFADVILPASAQPEKPGTYTNSNRQIQLAMPVRKPPGMAMQDWELIVKIANKCGQNWDYRSIGDVYTEMATNMKSLDNISWERLLKEEAVCYPAKSKNKPGEEIIFYDGFPTKDGKAKLVPSNLIPPNETIDEKYPLILTTGRLLEHWHTGIMTRHAKHLNVQEPRAIVSMHPDDIKKLGFSKGQLVKVKTRRGEIVLNIRLDNDLKPGMIFIPFCFNEAPANILTSSQLDPYGKIPEFKYSAARVEEI